MSMFKDVPLTGNIFSLIHQRLDILRIAFPRFVVRDLRGDTRCPKNACTCWSQI